MIFVTKGTGLIAGGTLIKDAEVRELSTSKQKLSFPLRYGYEKPAEQGARHGPGKLLDVDIWSGIDALYGMLQKDDVVLAVADEVRSREYGGKTYHSISPSGVFPSAAVVLRWMQTVLDILGSTAEELRTENTALRAEIAEIRQALERAGGVPSPSAAHPPEGQVPPMQQTPPVPSGGARGGQAADTAEPPPAENAGSLAGYELYEGEQLSDYAPSWGVQGGPPAKRGEGPWRSGGRVPAPNNVAAEPQIDEVDDLPF